MRSDKLRILIFSMLLVLIIIGSPGSTFNGYKVDDILAMGPDRQRFTPEAEEWTINFTLVDTGLHNASPDVSLHGVKLNGKPVNPNYIEVKYEDNGSLPLMRTGNVIPRKDMMKYYQLRQEKEELGDMSPLQEKSYDELTRSIEEKIWLTPEEAQEVSPEFARKENANALIITTDPMQISNNVEYELKVEFAVTSPGSDQHIIDFDTMVTVVSLSDLISQRQSAPGEIALQSITGGYWVPGDLHVHSTNSDGKYDPPDLMQKHIDAGFTWAYFTDAMHTKELVTDEEFHQIQQDYMLLSGEHFTVFPGLETAINPDDDGHLLVYGTNYTIIGLEENLKGPQEMIDEALANNPAGPSSSSIAHPACHFFPWDYFTVFGYHGIEIMVGGVPGLGGTGLGAGHVEAWRSEMIRLQDYIIEEGGYIPSVRTGTDYHGYPLEMFRDWVTWVYLPDPWESYSYHGRKAAVDHSLYNGTTTVSRHGSFGNFTLGGNLVGTTVHGVEPNSKMTLDVEYFAASSGEVRVRIFRRDMIQTVFDKNVNLNVGQSAQWSEEITFPGGDQYYWLYAEGPEDVYSTAIYVTGKGYNINLFANPAEGGAVLGAGNYQPGNPVIVEAQPHPDYYFHSWTEDGEEVSREAFYSFTSERHRNLTANFRPRLFTFDTSSISAGTTNYLIDSEGNVRGWRDGEPQKYSRDLWGGLKAVDVSAGNSYCRNYEYVFVVVADGSLWSWGSSNYGQLGHGLAQQSINTPKKITSTNWGGNNVIKVQAGNYSNHVFALTDDGSLWSWGHFRHSGLPAPGEGYAISVPAKIERTSYVHGSGTLISTNVPWNGEEVVYAATGNSLNIAVTSAGNIWTWGKGALQLGHGTSHNFMDRPTLVESTSWGGSKVLTASVGNGFCAAVTADGSLWTWGRSSTGQEDASWSALGHGNTEDKPVPVKITSTNWGGALVKEVAAGHAHINVLTADGNVWAWGRNYKGELGFNDEENRNVPEKIATTDWGGAMVKEISTVRINYPERALKTGDLHTIALTIDGKIWYWGNLNEIPVPFPEQYQ